MEVKQQLAADFGYGLCKFRYNDEYLIIPTAVARARLTQASFEHAISYEFEGKNWLVGESAVRDAMATRDYHFLELYAPLFLFEAIRYFVIDTSQPIELSTGLSLSNWNNRAKFSERLSDFVVNKIRINNIRTLFTPQGKGAYLAILQKHHELANKLVCVIDIGTYTLDAIWFENGRALLADSWASHHGTFLIIKELQKHINSRFSISSSEAEINTVLRTMKMSLAGDECDFSIFIEQEKEDYLNLILDKVKNENANLYQRADAIIFAGGGASLCADYLGNDKQFIVCDNPQLANVDGYASLLV